MKLPEKQIEDVDLPHMPETFVDSLGLGTFDGNTMRLELRITRVNPPAPPAPPSARRFPACRLIMTPQLVIDLHNQLSQFIGVMEQQGLVKREGGQPKTVN